MKNNTHITVSVKGWLECGDRVFRCSLGRHGVTNEKREGDRATPAGIFPLRRLLYRQDRLPAPACNLATAPIQPDDGWCDEPSHPAYNQLVTLPLEVSTERMWRKDQLYDLVLILGHNDDPIVPGLGSAIFLHVASDGYDPTEGCIALAKQDLLIVLEEVTPNSCIQIKGS